MTLPHIRMTLTFTYPFNPKWPNGTLEAASDWVWDFMKIIKERAEYGPTFVAGEIVWPNHGFPDVVLPDTKPSWY